MIDSKLGQLIPVETVDQDSCGSIFPSSLIGLSQCRTAHATSRQLWDDLHRPHQLGLGCWPNRTLADWIFYGP